MIDIVRAYGYDSRPTADADRREVFHRKTGEVVGTMTAAEASEWVKSLARAESLMTPAAP